MFSQPDYFNERAKTRNELALGMLSYMASMNQQKRQLEQEAARSKEAQEAFSQFAQQGGGASAPSGMIMKPTYTVGPNGPSMSYTYIPDPTLLAKAKADMIMSRQKEMADYNQKLKGEAPLSADAAGRYIFAKETKRNLPKVKNVLFPDGTPKSFNRTLATKIMAGKFPNDKDSQEVKRWLTNALTMRGLIQSGTVVKDNEWGRLLSAFGVDILSSGDAALNAVNEQEMFANDFMDAVRPGLKGKTSLNEKSDDSDLTSLWE